MQANNGAIEEKFFLIQVDGPPRKRGSLKRQWMDVVRIDMKKCNLYEDLTQDIDVIGETYFMQPNPNVVGTRY